ncbi:hypothetical protein DSCO28_02040 [Desulfosarcina ovata subsp. sediminis]|uniref:Uncharacterized protein n=1 Tax=Desulfosarcina ovata subsp. sediminis TaxID=885957 RepID=A0A5K7ZBU9_9BACT|nr:hypothetical protein [Desulfosarcina ovata]BBO79638.1 hypothetical protein DSCO28_02040 [Desulfosarcina ovata subsp. sediminis]
MKVEENNNVIPEFLIQLTTGLSGHIKSASRLWLGLAIISIVTISFTINTQELREQKINKEISLPFSLGKIHRNEFYPFSASLLSILIIAFGAAQAQSIRSRKMLNKALREMKTTIKLPGGCDIRDSIDVISVNSINRTVPLAQLLLGKYQFYPEKNHQNCILKIISVLYQIVLKFVSYLVVYCLPGYALFVAFYYGKLFDKTTTLWGLPIIILWFVATVGAVILIQLLLLEILYAVRSVGKIYNIIK